MIASALLAGFMLAQAAPDMPPPGFTGGPPAGMRGRPSASATDKAPEKPAAPKEKDPDNMGDDDKPVVTHHQVTLGGKVMKYTVTTGFMPLKDAAGEAQAHMFFMAYTLDNPAPGSKRPLMFSFNGGPGSSSVWLHLGTIGPRRVKLMDNGSLPPPPFTLVDNADTWLDQTDLVFIDPVGTGYSHAEKPENNRTYFGNQPDRDSIAEFIRLYLTRNERWTSPLFVVGESYGTFRAAGLAGDLMDKGIALNGVLLISSVLNFQTAAFGSGDDMSYELYLPTYAAAAWYHKKLPADLQARPLADVLSEVENWASTDYALKLAKGNRITDAEKNDVEDKLARYTGLSRTYVDNTNIRVEADRFYKELLRDRKQTIGRYDARFTGTDADAAGEGADYDPSYAVVQSPFTMTFGNYLREELGYKSDRTYGILNNVFPWDFGRREGYPSTTEPLRSALTQNPYLKVFVAEGHYDMATPYYAAQYTMSHLTADANAESRITQAQYDAGHMMYIDTPSRAKLHRDVSAFLNSALNAAPVNVAATP